MEVLPCIDLSMESTGPPNATVTLTVRTLVLTLLIYLTLVFVFGVVGVTALDWFEYQHLAQNAVKTVGRVTAKEPDNHNFIKYSFEVDHRSFSGKGNAGGENPSFDELRVGDPLAVYYDPGNPEHSFLGSPKSQAQSVTAGVIFITVGGSLFSIVGMYSRRWLPIFSTES